MTRSRPLTQFVYWEVTNRQRHKTRENTSWGIGYLATTGGTSARKCQTANATSSRWGAADLHMKQSWEDTTPTIFMARGFLDWDLRKKWWVLLHHTLEACIYIQHMYVLQVSFGESWYLTDKQDIYINNWIVSRKSLKSIFISSFINIHRISLRLSESSFQLFIEFLFISLKKKVKQLKKKLFTRKRMLSQDNGSMEGFQVITTSWILNVIDCH